MTQLQINTQWMRIARAVVKAYQQVEKGYIDERVFNSKLACVEQAKATVRQAQHELNMRINNHG